MADTWFLVPARAGSKGIPRKNTRQLAGRPLILHCLGSIRAVAPADRTIVSTDDPLVAHLVEGKATAWSRPPEVSGDAATLDALAAHVARRLLEQGAAADDILVTVQPTSPFIGADALRACVAAMDQGAASVLSVRDDRHLRWTVGPDGPRPLNDQRLNRQWLPPTYAETGGVIACRLGRVNESGTRIHEPVHLLELEGAEALDIDDFMDWAVAEAQARRVRIALWTIGGHRRGLGHVYRCAALMDVWGGHDVKFYFQDPDGIVAPLLTDQPAAVSLDDNEAFLRHLKESPVDLVVLDVLDTSEDFVRRVHEIAPCVVTFEDHGPGARPADLVVNHLYPRPSPGAANELAGVQYAVLAPGFDCVRPRDPKDEVEQVLVTFGGTDPARLTHLALNALARTGTRAAVHVVLGPGYDGPPIDLASLGLRGEVMKSVTNMALVMRDADLALTSAGRTVTELLCMGVPPIVLCQNTKELMHTHATGMFGALNLGMGDRMDSRTLAKHIDLLLRDRELRMTLRTRALEATKDRSTKALCDRILATCRERMRDAP